MFYISKSVFSNQQVEKALVRLRDTNMIKGVRCDWRDWEAVLRQLYCRLQDLQAHRQVFGNCSKERNLGIRAKGFGPSPGSSTVECRVSPNISAPIDLPTALLDIYARPHAELPRSNLAPLLEIMMPHLLCRLHASHVKHAAGRGKAPYFRQRQLAERLHGVLPERGRAWHGHSQRTSRG